MYCMLYAIYCILCTTYCILQTTYNILYFFTPARQPQARRVPTPVATNVARGPPRRGRVRRRGGYARAAGWPSRTRSEFPRERRFQNCRFRCSCANLIGDVTVKNLTTNLRIAFHRPVEPGTANRVLWPELWLTRVTEEGHLSHQVLRELAKHMSKEGATLSQIIIPERTHEVVDPRFSACWFANWNTRSFVFCRLI